MSGLRKHDQNIVIDYISFICMVILLLTGLLLEFRLPPGGHNAQVLGLGRHDWGTIHFIVALIFTAGIVVHMILHLPWLKSVLNPKDEKKRKDAVMIFSLSIYVLLILTMILFFSPVVQNN